MILFGTYANAAALPLRPPGRAAARYSTPRFALLIVYTPSASPVLDGGLWALSPALRRLSSAVSCWRIRNSVHELESDIEPFKGLPARPVLTSPSAPAIRFSPCLQTHVLSPITPPPPPYWNGPRAHGDEGAYPLCPRDRVPSEGTWTNGFSPSGLAQAGEFGFVLVSFSLQQQGATPPGQGQTLLLVVTLSMLLTPLFFIGYEGLVEAPPGNTSPTRRRSDIDEQNAIIIAGIGRFGQVVNRLLAGGRPPRRPSSTTISRERSTWKSAVSGSRGSSADPTPARPSARGGAETARKFWSSRWTTPPAALPPREPNKARRERPDIHIVARARDRVHTYELYRPVLRPAFVREMFDTAPCAPRRYVLLSRATFVSLKSTSEPLLSEC